MAVCLTGLRSAGPACVPTNVSDGLPSSRPPIVRVAGALALRSIRMMHLLERLALSFEAAEVPIMALKGAALNLTLPVGPGDRPMDDLDVLVRPELAGRAAEILERFGCLRGEPLVREDFFPRFHYEREYRSGVIDPVKIDLHVRPFRPLRYSRTVPADALWSRARAVRCGASSVWVPSTEDMVVHLAAHGAIHGNARRMWLVDIYRWIHARAGELNWDEVLRTTRAWGLVLPVRAGLERVECEVGPACPGDVLGSLRGMRAGWRERLALRQAPRDATHPGAHIVADALCTPGAGFVLSYLAAVAFPGRGHMADWYGRRHFGWLPCAHALRLLRPVLVCFPKVWRRLTRIETRVSGIHGMGVWATRDFRPGQVIVRYHGRPVNAPGMYVGFTQRKGERVQHFELTGKLRFLNHSCRPNARLAGFELLAVRSIEAGQEITIDYGPTACTCRSRSERHEPG